MNQGLAPLGVASTRQDIKRHTDMASAMPWLLGKRDRFLEEPMAQQNKRECAYGGARAVLSAKQVSSTRARRRSSDSTRA